METSFDDPSDHANSTLIHLDISAQDSRNSIHLSSPSSQLSELMRCRYVKKGKSGEQRFIKVAPLWVFSFKQTGHYAVEQSLLNSLRYRTLSLLD